MQGKRLKIERSESLEKLYRQYTHLQSGGKEVRCPYWSNRQRILLSGPYKGKGTPAQITKSTEKVAKANRIKLKKMTPGQIRKFMEHHRIGVDCSGFVFHMADALDKEKGGQGIWKKVEGVRGKGVRKVNAFCLTNKKNSLIIKKVGQIQVGDFIRFNAGRHIAIVTRVKREKTGRPVEVVYAHSGRLSAITGVHLAKFLVKNPEGDLNDQKWFEKTRKGYDFLATSFSEKEGDGIRRLKIWV